ncbi:MAG: sulfatase-like hydrolase/transferase [Planctomycetaceae bacterium]
MIRAHRDAWLVVCLVLSPAVWLSAAKDVAAGAANAQRPNIVFILTDDQAPWALAHSGYAQAKTPHIDRICREGAYFVNAFCSTPVCSPSRASIMTSRFGSELGITEWINPRTESTLGLDPKTPTWPKLLAEAGYRNGLVGKWHLGTEDRFHPTQFGYQYFMGFRAGGTKPKDPVLEVDGHDKQLSGFVVDLLTDSAIEYVNHHKDEPFVLSLHFREPHRPWLPIADEDAALFADLDPSIPNPDYPKLDVAKVKAMTRDYLASVESVDRNVGRLMHELDRLDLTKNTVVIFSSDHGYNMGHHGIWHKGNGHWILTENPPGTANVPAGERPNMYDTSVRVPLAVRWPGVVAPGTVVTQTVSHLDWFPTLLEVAGVEAPQGVTLRGRSIVPLLKGTAGEWNNDFYAEYSTHDNSRTHMRMYRTPEWKLVRDFLNPGRDELYHLKADPDETTNLIASEDPQVAAVKADLDTKLRARMQATDDKALTGTTKLETK